MPTGDEGHAILSRRRRVSPLMAPVTDGDIARLAGCELPAVRQADVQVLVSSTIRAAAERVEAPARLRAALAAERRGGGNPADRLSRSTGMATDTSSFPAPAARRASWAP